MAHDHVVENNPRNEVLLALVGIALFAAMVVLIALSAWLRPVAPDTQAMIAQREAAAAPKTADAAAPTGMAPAAEAAPAVTPAADSLVATASVTPAADTATTEPASAVGTSNAVTGGETQAEKVAEAGASTVKTTN